MLSKLRNKLKIPKQLVLETIAYGKRLLRYNASMNTKEDIGKMQYTLLRENHIIEKGMSMRTPRKGFGQQKVTALMEHLHNYVVRYGGDAAFLLYPLSTIAQYIQYTKSSGVDIPTIETQFADLLAFANINYAQLHITAGISKVTKETLQKQSKLSFEDLLKSRHSIRYYSKEDIPTKEQIETALEMAQRTPSACNRQSWHTHVFFDQAAHDLLIAQGGANGFEKEIPCAILVTADMRAFLSYEPMQCYVDGGLYAMNLINALHSTGLGTIPLSCGFSQSKLDKMALDFDIPLNESMICIIGVGCLLDEFNIAESTRKDISLTNTYH